MTRLVPGDVAPAFSLHSAQGKLISLASFAGGKLVLYSYPAAMTSGCTIQAVDFTAAAAEFEAAGYAICGISPDTPEKLAKFTSRDSLTITLLSDPDRTTLEAYGAWGERSVYGKMITGVIRSTFVIEVDEAGQGTIIEADYNVKASGHVQRLKEKLGLA